MRAKLLQRRAAERETSFQGIPIHIEWEKGATRTGTDKEGKPWSRKMECAYGFVEETRAVGDGENLDVYLGPDKEAPDAYAIEQLQDDGSPDELKVMLGFRSQEEARLMYLQHYPDGWEDHIGDIFSIPVTRLKTMVEAHQGDTEAQAILNEQTEQRATEFEQEMADHLGLDGPDGFLHEVNRVCESGSLRRAFRKLEYQVGGIPQGELSAFLFRLPVDKALEVMRYALGDRAETGITEQGFAR